MKTTVKISYDATAVSPIAHGADTKEGNNMLFRTQTVLANKQTEHSTRFEDHQDKERLQALGLLICRIDEHVTYRKGIYDEYVSQLRVCAGKRNKYEALNAFCDRFDVRNCVSNYNRRFDTMDIIELFDDKELQYYFSRHAIPIIAYFLSIKNSAGKANPNTKKDIQKTTVLGDNAPLAEDKSLDVVVQDLLTKIKEQPFKKKLQDAKHDIPFVSGNSVRGIARRLMAEDFCETLDIKLSPTLYHALFTGGALTEGGGDENIHLRKELIKHIPLVGLLGTAIGSSMIKSSLIVSDMSVVCAELYPEQTDMSFYDMLEMRFQTRSDSSKQEQSWIIQNTATIDDLIKEEAKQSTQMFYLFETLARGTRLKQKLICQSHDEIIISAFWRMLELFVENPYIGAKKSLGLGELDLSQLKAQIPIDGSKKYLDFLQNKKDEIKEFIQKMSEPKAAKAKAKK